MHLAGSARRPTNRSRSAVLWFVAAASFVPVIFWNAVEWLRTEDDPDTELLALMRAERRRGPPPLAGGDGTPSS